MDINVKHTHFMGKASSLTFVRTALALKKEFMPSSNLQRGRDGLAMRQPEFYDSMMVGYEFYSWKMLINIPYSV